MGIKFKNYCIVLISLFVCVFLVGCTKQLSPEELIKKQYGNKEYTISFSAEELDKPLKAEKYSMNRIPELPVPEKCGYIFLGWYFDKGFRYQYDDKLLLLKASDVVLYPKWVKEEFIENGKYNIDFEASIVQETLSKGPLADKYGYKDFSNNISKTNTYIEKRDEKKILRINYDGGTTVPFGHTSPFEVGTSGRSTQLKIVEKNQNLSTSIKDIFIDITNHQMTTPIYLTVVTKNYHKQGLSEGERNQTETKYDIEFKITKIKGLGETYVNSTNGLADGHYLAKSFYRQIDNKETMMSGFNPVFGYIVAENNEYKYVKEVNPYYGLLGNIADLEKPLNKNFYSRGTTFANFYTAYTIDFNPDKPKAMSDGDDHLLINSDFYPRTYKAGRTIEFSLEYDSDNNRMWQVFNLGNRLDKHLVAVGAPTGFMEVVGHQGKVSQIITIDYKTMLRVPAEYKPIKGNSYVFQQETHYYAGSESDLATSGVAYQEQKKIGTSNEFPNFFFATNNPNNKTGKIKSFRMTTSGDEKEIKDSKNRLTRVTAKYEIFDFNVQNEYLIGDMMMIQLFNSNGWRNQHKIMVNGKMLPFGTEVHIPTLFNQKVTIQKKDYQVKIFKRSTDTGKYSEQVPISGDYFTFNEDVNLFFTILENGFTKTAQVCLRKYVEPEFNLNANTTDNFDTSKKYHAGEKYSLPVNAEGKWGDKITTYLGDWYTDPEHKVMRNPIYIAQYEKKHGKIQFMSEDLKTYKDFTVMQGVEEVTWVFYVENVFGEVKSFEVVLGTEPNPEYIVKNNHGDVLSRRISRKDKDGNTIPENTTVVVSVDSEVEFKKYGLDTFKYSVGSEEGTFEIYEYYLITADGNEEDYKEGIASDVVYDELYEKVKTKGGIITVRYKSNKERFNIQLIVNGIFGDNKELKATPYRTLFTGQKYLFGEKFIKDKDGRILAKNNLDIHYTINDREVYNNGQYYIEESLETPYKYVTFNEPGKYIFAYRYFASNLFFTKSIVVNVKERTGDVEVKYVTDSAHPFKDGSTEKTIIHSLRNEFVFLDQTAFLPTEDLIISYSYGTKEFKKPFNYPYKVSNYVKEFNSDKIEIQINWDPGVYVTLNLDKAKTGFDSIDSHKIYRSSKIEKKYLLTNKNIDVNEIIKSKANDINKKFVLVGIESSVFSGGYISIEDYNNNTNLRVESSIEFKLVYKRKMRLRYEMDKTYTTKHFVNGHILEDMPLGEENYKEVTLKPEYQSTHRFVGWYLKGDSAQTIIDFKTFKAREADAINGLITIVAKFETI